MDNRQLQIFQAVAEQQSFTRAAEHLHMAQPAVSIAIKKLEQSLAVRLFDRSDRHIQLTAEGERLLLHANKILTQFDQAQLELKEMAELNRGVVRLGTSAMLGSYYFPEIISRFIQSHPGLDVQISGEGTSRATELLLAGKIDIAIVTLEQLPEELEAIPLTREEVVACLSPEHPFADRKNLSFKAFASQPLILYQPGYQLRELAERLCHQQNITPQIKVETNLLRLMLTLVQQQQGICIGLKRLVEEEKQLVGLSFEKKQYLKLGLAWRRDHYLSKANQAFIDFLLQK